MEASGIALANSTCIGRAVKAWSFDSVYVNLSSFQSSWCLPANVTLSKMFLGWSARHARRYDSGHVIACALCTAELLYTCTGYIPSRDVGHVSFAIWDSLFHSLFAWWGGYSSSEVPLQCQRRCFRPGHMPQSLPAWHHKHMDCCWCACMVLTPACGAAEISACTAWPGATIDPVRSGGWGSRLCKAVIAWCVSPGQTHKTRQDKTRQDKTRQDKTRTTPLPASQANEVFDLILIRSRLAHA